MTTFSRFLSPILGMVPSRLTDYFRNSRSPKPLSTGEILRNFRSGKRRKVRQAADEILRQFQNRDTMLPLLFHLPDIEKETNGLKMGGPYAPNRVILDFAIKTLQFYRDSPECPCNLYMEFERFDPNREKEKGYVAMLNFVRINRGPVEFYIVRCCKCGQVFHVMEKDYPNSWWRWTKHVPDPWTFDYHLDFPSPTKKQRLVYGQLIEVGMGAPLRGDCYLETEDKQRIKIPHCGGPPAWDTTSKLIAIPLWTEDRCQRLGVFNVETNELTVFRERFGIVIHPTAFDNNVISLRGISFDIRKKKVESVVALA